MSEVDVAFRRRSGRCRDLPRHGGVRDVINCYCERCRRFTGHYMAATAAAFVEVTIDDPTLQLTWHPVNGA